MKAIVFTAWILISALAGAAITNIAIRYEIAATVECSTDSDCYEKFGAYPYE